MEHQAAPSIFPSLAGKRAGPYDALSHALYPAVEILHIIGFVVLVGSILALDLRMLGLGRIDRDPADGAIVVTVVARRLCARDLHGIFAVFRRCVARREKPGVPGRRPC